MGVPTNPGMGGGQTYRNDIGLGAGNRIGYVKLTFWSRRQEPEGTEERCQRFRERLCRLIETDEELQAVLAEQLQSLEGD